MVINQFDFQPLQMGEIRRFEKNAKKRNRQHTLTTDLQAESAEGRFRENIDSVFLNHETQGSVALM